eukprot:4167168-Pyramimonas_sp.AAC.1
MNAPTRVCPRPTAARSSSSSPNTDRARERVEPRPLVPELFHYFTAASVAGTVSAPDIQSPSSSSSESR